MFLHSQVSISGFLQETGLLKFLDSVGVEVLKGSIKETDFGGNDSSSPYPPLPTQIILGKYLVRYLGRKFSLSYYFAKDNNDVSGELYEFNSDYERDNFESSRTYISAITNEITIDLLRKLALHFDAYLDERYKASEDRCFRKVSQL
jgi:hypothetical protein